MLPFPHSPPHSIPSSPHCPTSTLRCNWVARKSIPKEIAGGSAILFSGWYTQCFPQERKGGGLLVVHMLEVVLGPCSLVRKGTAMLQQINYSDRHQWVSCYITVAHSRKHQGLLSKVVRAGLLHEPD